MNRLPTETLREIFLQSLQEKYAQPSAVQPPLNISHVCQSWRDITISFGALWTSLSLAYHGYGDKAITDILDTWLKRSGTSPLNYKITCSLEVGQSRGKKAQIAAENIITTMLLHQKRWRDVKFRWCHLKLSPEFQGIYALEMPLLIRLELSVSGVNAGDKEIRPHLSIASSPRLKSLNFSGDSFFDVGEAPIHSLTQLSYCVINSPYDERETASKCLGFLRIAPNLKHFDAEVSFERDGFEPSSSPSADQTIVVLPHLTTLYIGDSSSMGLILSRLYTPALKVLSYCTDHVFGSQFSLDFIQRSLPPLTSLDLVGCECTQEEYLLDSLRLLPVLRDLRVLSITMTHFMEEFTIEGGRDVICPALEQLWLGGVDIVYRDAQDPAAAIGVMIVSRWTLTGSFKTVALVDFWDDVTSVEDSEDVQRCIKEGLVLQFDSTGLYCPPGRR